MYIRADKMFDSYDRTVIDILSMLGAVGGLKDFFLMIGSVLVGYITKKMFMSNILKKIYQIRKYENIKTQQSNQFKIQEIN